MLKVLAKGGKIAMVVHPGNVIMRPKLHDEWLDISYLSAKIAETKGLKLIARFSVPFPQSRLNQETTAKEIEKGNIINVLRDVLIFERCQV
jgi:hypothetical protein